MTDIDNDKLLTDAGRLAKDISPERDLWPKINEAINKATAGTTDQPEQASRRSRRMPMFAQAAAVVMLVGASSAITYFAVRGEQPVTRVAPELLFEQTAFGSTYNLGPGYLDARRALAAQLDKELPRLSPEARADVKRNLGVVRAAIDEINEALIDDPDNAVLQTKLLDAYHRELSLLRGVGGLTRNVMARNDI